MTLTKHIDSDGRVYYEGFEWVSQELDLGPELERRYRDICEKILLRQSIRAHLNKLRRHAKRPNGRGRGR